MPMPDLPKRLTVEVSFSDGISEDDRQAFLADLEAEGLSRPPPGTFLGQGAGGIVQPQVWIQLYLDGIVGGAGALTVAGFVTGVKMAVDKWRARGQSADRPAPAFNVVIVPVIYMVPQEDADAALDAAAAHYAKRGASKGDISWAPDHGWEDVEQVWSRKRAEAGEEGTLAEIDVRFSPAIDEAERKVFEQAVRTNSSVSLARSADPIQLSVSGHPAEFAVAIVFASGLSYLGQSAAKGIVSVVVRGVRGLRAHSVARGRASPIASIQLGRATYFMPDDVNEIVEVAMLAEHAGQHPPSGARYWDQSVGWESFEERAGRRRRGMAEEGG